MTDPAVRIARLIKQLEGRVTDLEQGRPPESAERRVENVDLESVKIQDLRNVTEVTDYVAKYNNGDNYGRTEYR